MAAVFSACLCQFSTSKNVQRAGDITSCGHLLTNLIIICEFEIEEKLVISSSE